MLYTVLPDCDSCKTKLDNTEMAQTFFFIFFIYLFFLFEHINHCLPQKHLKRLIKKAHNSTCTIINKTDKDKQHTTVVTKKFT